MALICKLNHKHAYGAGEAVSVEFVLTNTGMEDVAVLAWYTPLAGLWHDCFIVHGNDGRIPYDGYLVKRGRPTGESFTFLPAGSSLKSVVDLSQAYKISDPGKYKIKIDTYILVVTYLGRSWESMVLEAAPFQRLTSRTSRFHVESGGEERLTLGDSNRVAYRLEIRRDVIRGGPGPPALLAPQFNGGSADQQLQVQRAHGAAYVAITTALGYLAGYNAYKGTYVWWFGDFDGRRFASVVSVFESIKAGLESVTFIYDFTGTECFTDVFAYTTRGGSRIWVCGLFFQLCATALPAGVLLHEHSHASGNTEDNKRYTGSQDGAHRLARLYPDEAIRNANNYEYFSGAEL